MHKLLVYLLFVIPIFSFAQTAIYDSGGPILPEQAAYDVTFYDLSLQIHPKTKSISGTLAMTATALSELSVVVMHLDTLLKIEQIKQDIAGREHLIKWKRKAGLIYLFPEENVPADQAFTVSITYTGQPLAAPIKGGSWSDGFFWDQTKDGQPWIGNVSVLNGADIWWPCKDHPSDEADSMALHIRTDANLTVAANGRSRGITDHEDNTRTHHWFISTPINNYAVTINIAPYKTIETTFESVSGDRFPFIFWVLPEDEKKGKKQFKHFQRDMAFLEKTLGPYPFRADKYGIAQTSYFGMETQSIIAYGSDFKLNKYGFDFLHFHELAHEWFANMVTAADWKDWWIHEGFATYMEALYAEELRGEAAYHEYVAGFFKRVQNKAPLSPDGTFSTRQTYLPDVYAKGAVVLHMLRYLIGKENLLLAIRRMAYPDPELEKITNGAHCRLSSSEEFQEIVEEISGQNLDWFFEAYLKHKDPPVLEVFFTHTGHKANFEWKTAAKLPFTMPIHIKTGDKTHKIDMIDGKGSWGMSPELLIDQEKWILKKVISK